MSFAQEINLLPPDSLRQRTQQVYLRRVGVILRRIIGILLLLGGLLGGVYWSLDSLLGATQAQLSASINGDQAIIDEVGHINGLVRSVRSRVQGVQLITPLLSDVLQRVPESVTLSTLLYQHDTDSVIVRGNFASREALVALQRELELLPWVERVEAPLSNFATDEEREFSLTLFIQTEPD